MKIKEFFRAHPVFRYEAFQAFMEGRGVLPTSIRQLLSYYTKNGQLVRIRRGLYAVNPELSRAQSVDPYLVAAHAAPDAVLGYHTALELHNLAYTTFTELTYLTSIHATEFSFQGQHYRPTSYPNALIQQNKDEYDVETLQREGLSVRLTSLERTLVDVLDRPDLSGGWEEIVRSFDHLVRFDPQAIIDYVLLLNNRSTVAKVGYFLEGLPDYLKVSDHYLNQLVPHLPKQPHYLDPKRKSASAGTYVAKWQLIVPDYIAERRWEEPYDNAI